jgi:hypothetical protein
MDRSQSLHKKCTSQLELTCVRMIKGKLDALESLMCRHDNVISFCLFLHTDIEVVKVQVLNDQ